MDKDEPAMVCRRCYHFKPISAFRSLMELICASCLKGLWPETKPMTLALHFAGGCP